MADKRIRDLGKIATEADIVSGNYFALDCVDGTKMLGAENVATAKQGLIADNSFTLIEKTGESVNGYYNVAGIFVQSNDFVCMRFDVVGGNRYHFVLHLFANGYVDEFDENGNFIKAHNNYSGYSIEFTTLSNCSYIMAASKKTTFNDVKCWEVPSNDKIQKHLEEVEYIANLTKINENPLSTLDGYYPYDGSRAFIQNSSFKTLVFKVEPNTEYVVYGYSFGNMCVAELDDNNVSTRSIKRPVGVNSCYVQRIKTSCGCNKIAISTRISSKDIPELFIASTHKNESLKPTSIVSGYSNYSGTISSSVDFCTYRYEVKPFHKYKVQNIMYSSARICEYDSDNSFLGAVNARKTNLHYSESVEVVFRTRSNTKYINVPFYIVDSETNGIYSASVIDLGFCGVVVPDVFYGVVGVQKNIYNDRFGSEYCFIEPSDVDNDVQTRFHNRLELNPISVGESSIKITAYNSFEESVNGDTISEYLSKFKVVSRSNPSTAKNILWVGDSISDFQNSAKYVRDAMQNTDGGVVPTFVGTRHTNGCPDESYAGRNTYWLTTDSASPFVFNGSLNFESYNEERGVTKIDVCVMQMGFNDVEQITTANNPTDYMVKYYEMFVDKITQANPGIKIVWCLPPLEGKLVKKRDGLRHKNGINILRSQVVQLSKKFTNVIVSDAFYCIDSINGYPLEKKPIADVYGSLERTQDYCSDSTHPTALGCKEWSLSAYGAILFALNG